MKYLENKIFDEIKIGDSASIQRTLTQKDIELFAIMSGDVNPAHLDIDYAKDDMFHKIIGHGMWGASLISTVLGTKLPGPGTIYLNQTLNFKRPIALGDTVTITVTVTKKFPDNFHLELECVCINTESKVVIDGLATVIAPTVKVKRKQIELPKIVFEEPSKKY